MAGVEQLAPAPAAGRDVVPEEVTRREADQLRRAGPELLRHRRIDFGHALVSEHVIQDGVLVDVRSPCDRLIEHHKEEPILGALEERLQELASIALG